MDKLFLVAYTHEIGAVTHRREWKSISFGEDFAFLRTVKDIKHRIEAQTLDENVEVMAVTALHKLIDYSAELEIRDKIGGGEG